MLEKWFIVVKEKNVSSLSKKEKKKDVEKESDEEKRQKKGNKNGINWSEFRGNCLIFVLLVLTINICILILKWLLKDSIHLRFDSTDWLLLLQLMIPTITVVVNGTKNCTCN